MERKPLHSLALTCALVLAGATPAAAQDNDLDRCAELESDAARLACFDAVMQERRGETRAAGTPAEAAGAQSEIAPPGEAAATPDPVPAAAPQASAAPEPDAAAAEKTGKAKNEYTAVVTAMRTRPLGQVVVTLDNGESWSEQAASHRFLVEVGDTITMKKARFSSAYRLIAPGGRGYAMTRVDE
ncbi:MAG: hypothetical protein V2I25_04575 [Woeseiaceae bacterium]|nr:hypothetical protein [Woeseiaceae bacterium]